MNMQYDYLSPRRIVFGWGRRAEAGTIGASLGRRAFLVRGKSGKRAAAELADSLSNEGVELVELATLDHEPEVQDVDRASARLHELGAGQGDFLIGLGGGSALDLAKASAAMATNRASETVRDYLEGVGSGLSLDNDPLPMLAMPTTAGTGAEATKNAVISSYDPPFKKSLRHDLMMPAVALVDPELTVSLPAEVTASCGMDAITQLIESYISLRAKPIPQALALQGLKLALPALPIAVEQGENREAREAMAHAALLSGLALANSGLGLAHGVAPALGIHARVGHGTACALMLPAALRINREARGKELARLAHTALGVSRRSQDGAIDELIEAIEELADQIGVARRLGELGVDHEMIPAIVQSSRGNSMSGNPVKLSDTELTEILKGLL